MNRSWKLLLKIIIDLTLCALVAVPILVLWIAGKPFQRGFFCDDQSLIHPYRDDTVSLAVLLTVSICVPFITILIIEVTRGQLNLDSDREFRLFNWDVPTTLQNCYKYIGFFSFGAAVSQTTTDITKYSIGRLRPHFISLCNPIMSDGTTCSNSQNLNRYIQDFNCFNIEASDKMLREARLSFPSGHASFGFYSMVYCAFYLNTRLNWKGSAILRHFIQFWMIAFALYTSLTRISDYKHHWSDVLAGSVLGIGVASIVRFGIAKKVFTDTNEEEKLPLRQDRVTGVSSF